MRRSPRNRQGISLVVIMISLLITASCSTPSSQRMRSFDAAPSCCASMASFPYRSLASVQRATIELTAASPAFVFPSGKSYFAAFELPPFDGPYRIKIDSYLLGDENEIFLPVVLTLNGQHYVARSFPEDLFRPATTALNGNSGPPRTLTATIEVGEVERTERYLVILTREDLLGAWISTSSSNGEERSRIRTAPVGRLLLRVEQIVP